MGKKYIPAQWSDPGRSEKASYSWHEVEPLRIYGAIVPGSQLLFVSCMVVGMHQDLQEAYVSSSSSSEG